MQAIHKNPADWRVGPNLVDYDAARDTFSWEAARTELDGLPGGAGLNIAHECVDRHCRGTAGDRVALRWLDREGRAHDYTYARLRELTDRFANVLQGLGVGKGDLVCTLLGRVPALYIAAIGAWKNRSVFCALFSAFGPEPIQVRLAIGRARVLVTTPALYHRRVAALRDALPDLEHVLLLPADEQPRPPATRDLQALMDAADLRHGIGPTDPEDAALLHFTSGTTGSPKAAVHVHAAVVAHHATGRMALDLHPDDVFWCTADPGWVTGVSYGIIAPLAIGATVLVDEAEFDAERWYGLLQAQRVTVWYTAPTAVRMMMRLGAGLARRFDCSSLRLLASVGEPLNPEAVRWGEQAFGLPFHDNWWQTETGGIMIANLLAMDIRPGSMGRPLPGVEAAIVRREAGGAIEVVSEPDREGELALRPGWPSMFRGYLGDDERYRRCFAGGWYLTGDLARRDADGYFWFVGRADDLIKSAGHLIGPFEVESVLMEHPAVAEAGVIGKPDALVGEVVKAFVVLKAGQARPDDLTQQLLAHARRRLGAVVAPKEIEIRDELPKTRSGKIMRRVLRARELGLPTGDLSMLVSDDVEPRCRGSDGPESP
jgi:acetyl-CoA synthetase